LDGKIQDDNFRVINDLIYYKGQIVLVLGSTLKAKILHACHNSPVAGHQGISKTYRQVRERFCMERPQGRCDEACQRMHYMPRKQG
jgi:hypothetical protein